MKFKTKEGVIYRVNDKCINGITFKELAEKANLAAYSDIVIMFGKTINEIAYIICKYEEEQETKMTREEAIAKCKEIAHKSPSDHMIVLNILEVLGLIKFDKPIDELMIYDCDGDKQRVKFLEIEKVLCLAGYKVVKI